MRSPIIEPSTFSTNKRTQAYLKDATIKRTESSFFFAFLATDFGFFSIKLLFIQKTEISCRKKWSVKTKSEFQNVLSETSYGPEDLLGLICYTRLLQLQYNMIQWIVLLTGGGKLHPFNGVYIDRVWIKTFKKITFHFK